MVYEQRFHRIADGGPLDFGVHGDFFGHFQIGVGIHIDMANAFVMLNHRDFRAFRNRADQFFPAARHAKIDVLRQ